jgi:leucyl aminopeptidase
MTTIQPLKGPPQAITADAVACLVFEDKQSLKRQQRELARLLGPSSAPLKTAAFSGKLQQTLVLYPTTWKSHLLILVGAGPAAKFSVETLRRCASTAAKQARPHQVRSCALVEPDPDIASTTPIGNDEHLWERIGSGAAEGMLLGLYRYDRYITAKDSAERKLRKLFIATESGTRFRALQRGIRTGTIVAEAACVARDLGNAPGNEIYPATLADRARKIGRDHGIRVTVFEEKKIKALGMGGLLGVSQGSAKPPRFIVMETNRGSKRGTVVLVGKGVTFDSGGISIKPSAGMAEMKMDMSGAAVVLATMQAAAQLRIPIHIVGLVPATENLPAGTALKPGDILRHYNGKTSEVDNTDAEGRLILADALGYADRFKPDLVIDLATLTGACVVALGHVACGMLGNDEPMMARLKEAGERSYERPWQLPLFDEYEKLIKSDVADVKNVGGRWAGAITAAFFLKKFIGSYKWIHLDIAGPAIMEEPTDYTPRGASGFGVRLLVDFLQSWRTS